MKRTPLYLLMPLFLICMGCPSDIDNFPVKEITYEAMTRAQSEMIHVKAKNLTYKTRNDSKELTLSKEQLKSLYRVLKSIEYKEVGKLIAPSKKRLYDGAMSAVVTFKTESETYQSSSFDDDNPPAELKELVQLLKSFIN